MNNKGQTMVVFALLIPLLMLVMALVVDTGLMIHEKIKLTNVTKMIINDEIDNYSYDDVINIYQKNGISINNVYTEYKNNELEIKNEYEVDSIFGNIININLYKVKIDIIGYKENNEIIIKEIEG